MLDRKVRNIILEIRRWNSKIKNCSMSNMAFCFFGFRQTKQQHDDFDDIFNCYTFGKSFLDEKGHWQKLKKVWKIEIGFSPGVLTQTNVLTTRELKHE